MPKSNLVKQSESLELKGKKACPSFTLAERFIQGNFTIAEVCVLKPRSRRLHACNLIKKASFPTANAPWRTGDALQSA